MVIDDAWSLIGSANWDTRSFRLNFELNVELHDEASPARWPRWRRTAGGSRWPRSTATPADHGCATAPPGCCSLISSGPRGSRSVMTFQTGLETRAPSQASGSCADLRPGGRRARCSGVGRVRALRRPADRARSAGGRTGRSRACRRSVQARPCTRQRSSRKGTTLLAKCVDLARADVGEARQDEARAHRVVVADDRRRLAAQRRGDARELAAVEQLAVRQMDIGEGDLVDLHDLAAPPRQAAGQARGRQRQRRAASRSCAGSRPPGRGCGRARAGGDSGRGT